MAAALYQKLPATEALQVHEMYRQDRTLGVYGKITLDEAVFVEASALVVQCAEKFRLRSLDAIHLASALRSGIANFATFDARLAGGGRFHGLDRYPDPFLRGYPVWDGWWVWLVGRYSGSTAILPRPCSG